MNFEQLATIIADTHQRLQQSAVKAVNQCQTMRNWLIGFYIVEFEQNGEDRAKYGEFLLKNLEQKVNLKGLNITLFKRSRVFYMVYPQLATVIKTILPPTGASTMHLLEMQGLGKSASLMHLLQNAENKQDIVNTIEPQKLGLEYGLDYMLKPRLAYISSYCNYECTVCSDVCPTGAIKPLTIEEKTTTQVGIATFFKGRCVVNTEEKDCGACAEHCPTQAVHMVPYKGTLTIPQINPDLCIGCGGCESICPVRPMRAIIVKSNVEHKFVEKPKEEEIKEIEVDDFGF